MSTTLKVAALQKFARYGAGVLIAVGGGRFLLEENTEGESAGNLRPAGGGDQKSDWNLDETIVRELGEELGLSPEDALKHIYLAGYIPDGEFRGCAMYVLERTPDMEKAGLKPGVHQATNSKSETVKLVETTLDDERYIALKPHQLLSSPPSDTPGKEGAKGPEGVARILYAPERPQEEHGPGYCPSCHAYSPPGTVTDEKEWYTEITCGLCGYSCSDASWRHEPEGYDTPKVRHKIVVTQHTVEICPHCFEEIGEKEMYHDGIRWYHRPCEDAGPINIHVKAADTALSAPTRPSGTASPGTTTPPPAPYPLRPTPMTGPQLKMFDAASVPASVYGDNYLQQLNQARTFARENNLSHWNETHDRMERGFNVPVYDSRPRQRRPGNHIVNTVAWPSYHPASRTMEIVPADSKYKLPGFDLSVADQLDHEGRHALLETRSMHEAFPDQHMFVDEDLPYTADRGRREEILLGLSALQGDLFRTRGSRLESPEAARGWFDTVMGLDDDRFQRLLEPYSRDGANTMRFLRRLRGDRPERFQELIDRFAPEIPAMVQWRDGPGLAEKTAAVMGIPDREDYGDLRKLPLRTRIPFVRQRHQARQAGDHFDVRFGTPDTGLISFATRHPMPEPGGKRVLFRQPVHDFDYRTFQGEIPEGYGAGTVRREEEDEIVLTRLDDDRISFYTTHRKRPEFYTMIRQDGEGDGAEPWLLVNVTPRDPAKLIDDPRAFAKPRFKSVDSDAAQDFFQDHVIEAKIDGASGLFKLGDDGIDVLSYRIGKDGAPIIHTQRFFGEGSGKDLEVPPELKGKILRAEIYGEGPDGVLAPQKLSGILNSSVARALDTQRDGNIRLRAALFGIVGEEDLPPDERRAKLQVLADAMPDKFTLPEAADTPDTAAALWEYISSDRHAQTREGVMAYPKAGGTPVKIKLRPENDVYIRDIFPGTGKYGASAGGFAYSLQPDGPIVGRVGTGFDDAMRAHMLAHPEEYVGRVGRITASSQTDSGAYFQPSFIALHEDYPRQDTAMRKAASTLPLPRPTTILKSARDGVRPDARTGPEAIRAALLRLDMDAIESDARDDIASSKVTRRRPAVEKLRIIQGLRRNERSPEDLVLTAVPVIPAAFRPFAFAGETFVPGDANELYQDLIKLRDTYESLRDVVGEEGVQDLNLNLYDGVKALYGRGEAVLPKTRQRGVSGFLKQLVGTGPKQSFVQRKMLAKPQDFVGRAVITPDPDLGLDEIAVPEEIAWTAYAPHLQRRLSRRGYRKTDSVRMIRDRTPEARRELLAEMNERPVMYSRAPAWHKYSVLGGWPKLVESETISINPYVTAGLGADFDGNCVKVGTKLTVRIKNITVGLVADYAEKFIEIGVDKDSASGDAVRTMRITKDTRILAKLQDGVIVKIPIEQFPRNEGEKRQDKHGSDVYTVPEGVEVITNAPDGAGVRWSPATTFTVDGVKPIRRVVTSSKKEVEVSDNESIATYAPGGTIARIRPDDAIPGTTLIPTIRSLPESTTYSSDYDFEFGWMLGAFVSDGWVTESNMIGYTKADDAKRRRFLSALNAFCNEKLPFKQYMEAHDALTNGGVGGASEKIHINLRKESPRELYDLVALLDGCYDPSRRDHPEHRSCLYKRLPERFLEYSREVRLGILTGMLDGDGSVSVNNAKKRPQVLSSFGTSSRWLRDDIRLLCMSLGVRTSVTDSPPKAGRVQKHMAYVVTLSTADLATIAGELNTMSDYEGLRILREEGVSKDDRDVVPVDYEVLCDITKPGALDDTCPCTKSALATVKSSAKKHGYARVVRTTAELYLKHFTGDRTTPHWRALDNVTKDRTLTWETVKSVNEESPAEVFDIGVPETKVFALANGLIIYDTINVHVPARSETVEEIKNRLMPSRMVLSEADPSKVVNPPKHEQILGLYTAKHRPAVRHHVVANEDEALAGIESGTIGLRDTISFGSEELSPPTEQPSIIE